MWRGPVWANINYFLIEALRQIGEYPLAQELRDRTLKLIMNHCSSEDAISIRREAKRHIMMARQTDIYEYYNSHTGQPPATAADTFGWTAVVFIDLAIQASQEENAE